MEGKVKEAYQHLITALEIQGLQYYALEDTLSTKDFIKQSVQNGGHSVVAWELPEFDPTKALVVYTTPNSNVQAVSEKIGRRLKTLGTALKECNIHKNVPVVFFGCDWSSARDFARNNPDTPTWFMGKLNSNQIIMMECFDKGSKQSLKIKSLIPPNFSSYEQCALYFVDKRGYLYSTGQKELYLPNFKQPHLSTRRKHHERDGAAATQRTNNAVDVEVTAKASTPVHSQHYDFGGSQDTKDPQDAVGLSSWDSPRVRDSYVHAAMRFASDLFKGQQSGAAARYHGFVHPQVSPIAMPSRAADVKGKRTSSFDVDKELSPSEYERLGIPVKVDAKRPRTASFDADRAVCSNEFQQHYGCEHIDPFQNLDPRRKESSPRR